MKNIATSYVSSSYLLKTKTISFLSIFIYIFLFDEITQSMLCHYAFNCLIAHTQNVVNNLSKFGFREPDARTIYRRSYLKVNFWNTDVAQF